MPAAFRPPFRWFAVGSTHSRRSAPSLVTDALHDFLALLIEIRTEPSGARVTDDDARRGMILNVSDRGARKSAVTAAPRVTGKFQSVVLGLANHVSVFGKLIDSPHGLDFAVGIDPNR